MKKILFAGFISLAITSAAIADIKEYDNPNKVQCGPGNEIWKVLKEKYGEKVEMMGSSGNTIGDKKSTLFFLTNLDTNTYSLVNFYRDSDMACVIDSGTIHKRFFVGPHV